MEKEKRSGRSEKEIGNNKYLRTAELSGPTRLAFE